MLGCTRCGNTVDDDEITIHNTFAFPHASGCGQGVGPIVLLPTKPTKKAATISETVPTEETHKKSTPKSE